MKVGILALAAAMALSACAHLRPAPAGDDPVRAGRPAVAGVSSMDSRRDIVLAVANPLNVQLSGFPAKVVTRAYHIYAIPRFVNRWAVSLAYLTDVFFDRSVVSFGLSTQEDARFSTSEGIPMPKPD